jgi:catechol 2,3-dioxygenase-like lactoylglutathione lyase family enzyme
MSDQANFEIAHVGLSVSRLDAALAFWEPFLGAAAHARAQLDRPYTASLVGIVGVEIAAAFVRIGDGGVLELLEYQTGERAAVAPDSSNPGHAHVCLYVADVVDATTRAVALGAKVVGDGPVLIDAGTNAGISAVYLRVPPDRHTVELFERRRSAADRSSATGSGGGSRGRREALR